MGAEVNRGADSPAAAAAVTRLGWKLGAWRRKLGATRTRIRIRVQRGTTSSTLTSSLSSHRNAALSQICALNRIRASKAARVRQGNRSRRSEVRPYPPPEMRSTNKLEKSRQSARECRARKKLRYQYLDDMIL